MTTELTTTKSISLNAPQTRAFDVFILNVCVILAFGRGVGKSTFQLLMWFLLVAKWDGVEREAAFGEKIRGIRIAVIGPTRKQLVDIYGGALNRALALDHDKGGWSFLGGKLNKTSMRIDFPGGSWIQFFGMESADAGRGVRCDFISADEADDIEISAYDGVSAPWLSEPWSFKLEILCGTPRRGRYGLLYARHSAAINQPHLGEADRKVANIFSFHATYRDAPENVDQAFVERQRKLLSPATFAREWECDFDAGEGLVYPMFGVESHVRLPDPGARPTETVVGVDWGFEDPGVFLVCDIYGSGQDAVVHVVEEIVQSHQTIDFWKLKARAVLAKRPRAVFFADPSQPANIESLRSVGCNIMQAKNDILDGVSAVADRLIQRPATIPCSRHIGKEEFEKCDECRTILRPPRILVSPNCPYTIKEIGLYKRRRDPRDRERYTEAFAPGNDHAMDSLRYAVFTRFGSPVVRRVVGSSHVA